MSENEMLVIADRYKELRDKKSELQEQEKAVQAKLDEVEAKLIELMTNEECAGFKRNGFTFSLVIREFPGAVPENKEALYAAMHEHGFDHLFTINPMTLSGTVKELKANNDDIMPEWLDGLINNFERPSIRVAKSK